MRRAPLLLIALAIAAGSLPVAAVDGQGDTPACTRNLKAAASGVSDTMGRLNASAKASDDEKCARFRQHFLVLVPISNTWGPPTSELSRIAFQRPVPKPWFISGNSHPIARWAPQCIL
jgi:hypothetical protein